MTLAKRRFCIEVEFTVNTESTPLLFLDFDGVTHPEPCGCAPLFQSLPLTEAVLRRHPGVLVALSTTRRITRLIEELREWFASDIESRVIDVTPVITL